MAQTTAPPLLSLQDIALSFGGDPLLRGTELHLFAGERVCLVGRNGCGKSTLLKIAAGMIEADSGTRKLKPGTTLRYLEQEPDFSGYSSTLAYAEADLSPGDDPNRVPRLLEALGLSGRENPAKISGGEARRAALVRALAPDPDILLLDEPTNHLDLPAIEWLEGYLANSRAAQVLISHDRRFLTALSQRTLWLDRGVMRRLDRGFGAFEAWRDEQLELEAQAQHKLSRKIAAEEDWMRYGVTARRKRNVRRVGELQALRRQRREARAASGQVVMAAAAAEASGRRVLEAKRLNKSFGERAIVADLSLVLQRGDRLGIAGPNGSGKTTLVSLLTGGMEPDSGTLKIGSNLEMISLDQRRESLDGSLSLAEALTEGRGDRVAVGEGQRHVISYMKDFLFAPEQAGTPISRLSGGERGRLALAIALAKPANLLVLDEPTNDLDLETLDLLEDLLAGYKGSVILVSHDRAFLDSIVTSLLVPAPEMGEGRWLEYVGGYSDMQAQRRAAEREAAEGEAPRAKTAKKKPPPSLAAKPPQKAKLSFKEKHALTTLPDRIATLEGQVARLRERMADPGLYGRDPEGYGQQAKDLARAEAALAASEEEWLRLELRREEVDGAGASS
ncbi:MAG: ATP-binding cassette domain-containing protein [Rhodospirillales bacterium]